MEEELKSLPLENASILSEGSLQDGHRLWIGNLDPKITEYHLLKLLQKFGKVKQFDFLFHKSGPLEGQPRGYCFVNFETKLEAERAIHCLNGKMALSKKLVVRWAHAQIKKYDNYKSEKVLPISLEPSTSTEQTQSTLSFEVKSCVCLHPIRLCSDDPIFPEQKPLSMSQIWTNILLHIFIYLFIFGAKFHPGFWMVVCRTEKATTGHGYNVEFYFVNITQGRVSQFPI
ncbi:probable RNA-binding protein 18 isoform X1 [Hyla sarda]|uniref:probable RNA-binding protein 18 isoform X1 n=1 Tax=Hyla sarda TaxID=327740 RepID=UPI0024C23F58|nr:probable RNA-binding protein 18 isoform X1 [Hyla sarda]XP_056397281.1 probable RNA-binding protein 18 isoform X1 [Hyla sarda]